MEPKRVDIFGSFLKGGSIASGTGIGEEGAALAGATSPPDLEKALLAALAAAKQPVDLKELMSGVNIAPSLLLQILREMEKVNLVKSTENATGGQVYLITPLGRDLAEAS